MSPEAPATICLIGFGEVGQTLVRDFTVTGGLTLRAYDILFADASSAPARARAGFPAVDFTATPEAAAGGAELLVSAVTAAEDLRAAESVANALTDGAWFVDVNSVSPGTKQDVARLIESHGGRYVEAAVMSPIQPQGAAAPMLLGGPHAAGFAPLAQRLGFTNAEVYSDTVGRASAAKMCRSVVIKGLEALLTESMLSARRYGVERTVLDTLGNVISGDDWEAQARYLLSRSLEHGARRAEEMREVAATVSEAGIEAWMSEACVKRQARTASFDTRAADESLAELLDTILAAHYPGQAGSSHD